MQLFICSVHDSAAQAYNRPFFAPSIGLAIRSFKDEVNRDSPDNPMFKHSDDYSLHQMGTFDDADGKITPTETPVLVNRAKDLKE